MNVWLSSLFLYTGDVFIVALTIAGACFCIGALIKRTHRYAIIDIDLRHLRIFAAFQVAWLACGLILFKFVGLQLAKASFTGNTGSVQFSTAGETVAAALGLYGLYKLSRLLFKHIRMAQL